MNTTVRARVVPGPGTALNLTPLGFVQRLRLERARHLAATTELNTADIAQRVGYANAETLRSLMRPGNKPS